MELLNLLASPLAGSALIHFVPDFFGMQVAYYFFTVGKTNDIAHFFRCVISGIC